MLSLESCDDYIYFVDKYFSKKGLELLAEAVEGNKVKEIKIVMAIDKVDESFRDLFKSFKKEMENNKNSLLGAIHGLKPVVLRSSHIASFWNEKFRTKVRGFKPCEISHKKITCELRVIVDSKVKSTIHDRFVISKYVTYNIPSPDIIARGQLSEITKSNNKEQLMKEFNKVWEVSKDLIQDWNKIKEALEEVKS